MTDYLDPTDSVAVPRTTVIVAHSIQPLTREEVRLLADNAFETIMARLTS